MRKRLLRIRLKVEKFVKDQLWQLLLVVAFVGFFAWLFDKPFEAVMFCIAHLIIRLNFYKQYHSKFISVCMVITISIAFWSILICLPIRVSLLSSIPLAFFVCWVGDILQTKIELKVENSNLKEEIKMMLRPQVFNVNTCTEQELIARCKKLHFSKENQDLAIEFFIMKTPHKFLAELHCTDTKSMTTRKKRMKQKLNKGNLTEDSNNDINNEISQ